MKISFGSYFNQCLGWSGLFCFFTACWGPTQSRQSWIYQESSRPGLVAKVGQEEITEEQLMSAVKLDYYEIQKKEFDFRKDRLKQLLVEKFVGEEAQKAQLSLEDFIQKRIIKKPVVISEKEYQKFLSDKHVDESQTNPQIKERIMGYLQSMKHQELIQQYADRLAKGRRIEVYFKKPRLKMDLEVGQSPVTSTAKAPVTLIAFSDFQCPFCARAAETVNAVRKKYGQKVQVVFKHFPLPMHRDAKAAAEASLCVYAQGRDRFWKYHDLVFRHQDQLDALSLEKYAKEVGANVEAFGACVKGHDFASAVQKDIHDAEQLGLKSTPMFFINGQVLSGAVPFETFVEMIDEALSEQK